MKADADEALGIAKAPQIHHFEMPFQIWITSSLMLFLIYSTYLPPNSKGVFWWLARTLRSIEFLDSIVFPAWVFTFIVHSAEGVYAATLMRKHRMTWPIGMAWVISTTIFGFPVLMRLRRLVKQARIESIMKGT